MVRILVASFVFFIANNLSAQEPIRFVRSPDISPDGNTVAFSYLGDIWLVDAKQDKVFKCTGAASRTSGKCRAFSRLRAIASACGGSRAQSTDWLFDGNDNNELTAGGIAILPSIDAIQEFKVLTYNYSAEYGRSAGGVVNTVTKSGTNSIHGEAFFYDRDNVWGAINPFTKISVPATPTTFNQVPYKPTDWRKMSGFGVGGPAIKDKLFWNLTFDWYKRNFPGTAVPGNANIFFGQATSASAASTIATRLGVSTTQAQTLYSNEFNGLVSMLGPTPREGELIYSAAR